MTGIFAVFSKRTYGSSIGIPGLITAASILSKSLSKSFPFITFTIFSTSFFLNWARSFFSSSFAFASKNTTSPPIARICFAAATPLLPVPNTKTFCLFILIPLFFLFPLFFTPAVHGCFLLFSKPILFSKPVHDVYPAHFFLM